MRHLLLSTYLYVGGLVDQVRRRLPRPHDQRGDSTVTNVLWIAFWVGIFAVIAGVIYAFINGKIAIMR